MNAMVILQKCGQSGKTFGIRVQQMEDGEWYETWAFPIDEARAGREGYTSMNIKSFLPQTAEYPGCPYCGTKGWFYDSNCKKISCYHGETRHSCPWCGGEYDVAMTQDKLDFSGGDL